MSAASTEATRLRRHEVHEPPFLARVRLHAQRHVLWLQHLWASAPGALGLAISAGEVARILDGPPAGAEQAFYDKNPAARALAAAIARADSAFVADPTIDRLRHALALESHELDLLTLAVAVEAEPWLRRVYGYIHDDATMTSPTPWLASRLFAWPAGTRIGPDSKLLTWQLARPLDGTNPWSVTAAWVADPLVASAITQGAVLAPGLGDAARLVAPPAEACLYPDELATLVGLVRALEPKQPQPAIELVIVGPSGAGKRTLAAQVFASLERPLIVVDGRALQGDALRDAVVRVVRTARLLDAGVYWHELDPGVLEVSPRISVVGTSMTITRGIADGAVRRVVRLPALTQAARAALWSSLSAASPPSPVLDWTLLPSDIARAATLSSAGDDAVIDACRSTLHIDAAALAAPVERPYVWDDLVVAPSIKRHLEELEAQARLRWPVYEEWGFGKFFPMGRGIAALFAGPSGTGKTMAAQVLARSLGMEIYRVDLAGVMSKYIGETEKNLRQVFDACERANVLLFFDEADALFGQRTQVKDAHDRFANIEIDYLLQRMEQFDGLAILATNRKNEIDQAFLRRVRFIIDFMPPGVAERRALWTRALPEHTPKGEPLLAEIDIGVLAERLDMTGADIKNAATSAAFLARSEGSRITMRHVLRAARRELAKHGVVLRGEIE